MVSANVSVGAIGLRPSPFGLSSKSGRTHQTQIQNSYQLFVISYWVGSYLGSSY
jgi:hypothetical protein